jgi:hypothetical protein
MHYIIALHFIFFSFGAIAGRVDADVVGEAFDMVKGDLLYRELHYYSSDKLDHRVEYVDAEGNEIAVKNVNYRRSFFAPEFSQKNTRYSGLMAVEWLGEKLQIRYSNGPADKLKKKLLSADFPLVIDAGFDYFIREKWSALLEGERIEFKYAAPSRLTLVELVVESSPCDGSGSESACFKITSPNWLIGLFLSPIELTYNTGDQRLSRFSGLANMIDKYGSGLEVNIVYRYSPL